MCSPLPSRFQSLSADCTFKLFLTCKKRAQPNLSLKADWKQSIGTRTTEHFEADGPTLFLFRKSVVAMA